MTTTVKEFVSSGSRDPALLLSSMQRAALERLGAALEETLRRTDDYLFDLSSNTGDGADLLALRDLRRARVQIAQRFEQSLTANFRRLYGVLPPRPSRAGEMSLLSDSALEQQLANEQMIESLGKLHAPALEVLDKRLAALLDRHELAKDENPVGPSALAETMRDALHATELPTGAHIVVIKFFERELSSVLQALYERMNASLISAGILPRLMPVARTTAPVPMGAQGQVYPHPQGQAYASAQGYAPMGAGHQVAGNYMGGPQFMVPGGAMPAGGMPIGAIASAAMSAAGVGGGEYVIQGHADHSLFSNLVGLLQSWRQTTTGGSTPRRGEGQSLGAQEIMSVLALMQSDPPSSLDSVVDDGRLSLAEQLRREVLLHARRLGIGGPDLNLSESDEDAVDLVGMLFDVLLDERDFEPDMRRKIGRMLVPYVRVAVKDRRLFLYKTHPARRLLNAVAEACEGNRGEATQERELLSRVDTTIERLITEFNEDLAIFETLEQELRSFMDQSRKRIELTERRTAEAQRGRERLEQARAQVTLDLTRTRGTRELPTVLDEFVSRFAHHHLTQVILRDGLESPRYGDSLHAVEALLAAFDHAELGEAPERLPELDRLWLHAILASSGCVGPGADQALATLQQALVQLAAGDDTAANAAKLPEQHIALEPPPQPEPLMAVGGTATLTFDAEVAERMRALEIGAWIELTSESGRVESAKVSWISPISSRFLFVNRRGIRVLVASAEELAAMAKEGKVKLREADTAFENAMHQIMDRLKTNSAPHVSAIP